VPEIGIGFLSYYFGSFITNLTTFAFLIIGLIFIYKSFIRILGTQMLLINKNKNEKFLAFLILCLTNHIVFRDSTIPIDFSWSFVFFSLGFYFITVKQIELATIFFSLCLASRLNFLVFILPTIFFLNQSFIDNKKKILVSIIILTYGGLFYLPSWLQSSFSLDFIFSSGWYEANKKEGVYTYVELIRFIYKVTTTLGLLFLFSAGFALLVHKKKIIPIFKNFKIQIILIVINIVLFFYFPWEPSYLWILIFSINFILIFIFSKKIIYFLIIINIFNWFFQFNILEVDYKYSEDMCYRMPIDARFVLHFDKGMLLTINIREQHSKCYPFILGKNLKILKYKSEISEGKKLSN